jgi:glycine cleavage system transcriptional repressor
MNNTYRVGVLGTGRSLSIVRRLSTDIAQEGCDLVAISTQTLGDHFGIMMVIDTDEGSNELRGYLDPIVEKFDLSLTVDAVEKFEFCHKFPDVSIHVHGADKIGVFSYCMAIFNDAGLEILSMHSDLLGKAVDGGEDEFLNVIKGRATEGIEELQRAAENLRNNSIDVSITVIEEEDEE